MFGELAWVGAEWDDFNHMSFHVKNRPLYFWKECVHLHFRNRWWFVLSRACIPAQFFCFYMICCNCTYIPQRKRCLHARFFTCLKPRCIHHKKRSTEKTHVIMKSHENFFLISKSCGLQKARNKKRSEKNHAVQLDIVLVKLLKMETLDCDTVVSYMFVLQDSKFQCWVPLQSLRNWCVHSLPWSGCHAKPIAGAVNVLRSRIDMFIYIYDLFLKCPNFVNK